MEREYMHWTGTAYWPGIASKHFSVCALPYAVLEYGMCFITDDFLLGA